MTLPDCAACGSRVVSDIDDTQGQVQVCTRCPISQKTIQPRPDRAAIRTAVRESRHRRLLGPSCLGRRHTRCTAQLCECTCHPDQRPRQPRRPDAPA